MAIMRIVVPAESMLATKEIPVTASRRLLVLIAHFPSQLFAEILVPKTKTDGPERMASARQAISNAFK